MITITSDHRLEKVFIDICGPFARSGGRHQFKYIVIIFDHYSKFTKLYPDKDYKQGHDKEDP